MASRIHHRSVIGNNLPKAAGPYSPGVIFDRLLFVSGQGDKDPATGKSPGDDVEAQTEQVLKNVSSILQAGGSSLEHVVRCTVYLTDIADFPKMNGVYQRMFGDNRPARTTVQVAALPAPGLKVEIDAIAYIP